MKQYLKVEVNFAGPYCKQECNHFSISSAWKAPYICTLFREELEHDFQPDRTRRCPQCVKKEVISS